VIAGGYAGRVGGAAGGAAGVPETITWQVAVRLPEELVAVRI
jgi:hypothetical protein